MKFANARWTVAWLVVVVIFAVPSLGVPTPSAVAHGAPVAVGGHALVAPSQASVARPPTYQPVTTCPTPDPIVWGTVNGVFPPPPLLSLQGPCPPVSMDYADATFASSAPGTAERWTIPVQLATGKGGSSDTGSAVFAYSEEYVGMIVAGDAHSAWGQSYAEMVFVPSFSGSSTSYAMSFHIFALEDAAVISGSGCLEITWNDTYECLEDYASSADTGSIVIPGGSTVDVTFAGVTGGTSGMEVWANDTSNSSLSASYSTSSASLGTGYTFEPMYNSSCVDACTLRWSFGMGLGIGFADCPTSAYYAATCSSYAQGDWTSFPPEGFGRPEAYAAGSYSTDYYYFAPESTSGICNTFAPSLTVAYCFNFDLYKGQGYYPYFTFNGSGIDFGSNSSYTLENLGGYSFEFPASGAPTSLVPFFFYRLSNTSLAGYIPPATALNVSTTLLDLGTVKSAEVTWSLNGATPTTTPMTFESGNASLGTYNATIPSGGNGVLNYTVTGINDAGAWINSSLFRVVRGPLPTFDVTVLTQDPQCAGVVLNGTNYTNGSVAHLHPGFYSLHASGCYPWQFTTWRSLSGGTTVVGPNGLTTTLEVSASGTIESYWLYVRPLDTLTLTSSPACGQILIGNQSYADNAVTQLLDSGNYTIGQVGCASKAFRGWTFVGPWKILGGVLTIFGNGTLTANYVPSSTASALVFQTNPLNCGGVLFFNAGYTTGESVSVGPGGYPIGPDPCSHWGFVNFTISGNGAVAANNSWVTLTGGATLTANYYVLTEVTIVVSPASCGPVSFDGQNESNGAVIVAANNSTHTIYAPTCPGHFLLAISGTGGVSVVGNLVTVTGSGALTVAYGSGNATQFLGFLTNPPSCGGIIEGGVEYTDSQFTKLAPGSIATVQAVPCPGYGFQAWITFGGITVVGSTAYFNGSGALEAQFQPLTGLLLFTSPTGCGSLKLGGSTYLGNTTAAVTEFVRYGLDATPCAGDEFVQWQNSSGAELTNGIYSANNTVTAIAEAILTAVFTPIRYTVSIGVTPAACGAIRVSNLAEINGTVLELPGGVYPVSPDPCLGDHLVAWEVSGGLTVIGPDLYVNGSGNLTALYQPVPPTVVLDVYNGSFSGQAVLIGATVAVPVPPYNYNYTWSFGDGSPEVTTPVNFTSHTYATAGHYQISVTVVDPLLRSATANATILIVPGTSFTQNLLTPLSITAIALVGVVALLALAVVLVGRRPRPPAPADSGPSAPSTPAAPAEPLPAPSEPDLSTGETTKP